MSTIYITSDWHLGHKSAIKWRTQFNSPEDHDSHILDRYREVVTKRDTVWFLGDIALTREALDQVAMLPGYKRLVLGNHDTDRNLTVKDYLEVFTGGIYSLYKTNDAWLSHAPIHRQELRGKYNIHGHVHSNTLPDKEYFNASLENTVYSPLPYQYILDILKRRTQT